MMAEKLNEAGKLPNAQVLKTCLSRAGAIDADLAESRGELGSFIKEVEEKHNIHRKAFKLTRQLDRMDQSKLAEFLRHFDHYRGIVKLDDKAGLDMFEGGAAAAESEPDGKAKGRKAPRPKAVDATVAAMSAVVKEGDDKIRETSARMAEADNGAERLRGLAPLPH